MLDLTQSDPQPVSQGLEGLNVEDLDNSDTCLYAGILVAGFHKSVGFSNRWQLFNDGLPADTGYIPPKFGGGIYLIRNVYSVGKNDLFVFAGTQRGLYRADPSDMSWESKNDGLPLNPVTLITNTGAAIYICIGDTMYRSTDNGDSWEGLFVSESKITSLNEIEDTLFMTTYGQGILYSTDDGSNWESFNSGLAHLHVNFIDKVDEVLVCGTASGGFYYFEKDFWKQNNSGIICSSVRSITATSNALVANDNENVYLLNKDDRWSIISPGISKSYFGSVASMGDTIFLSSDYNTSTYPYDQPVIVYTTDLGKTWKNLIHPVPFVRDDAYRIYCHRDRLYVYEDEIMYYTDDLGSTWKDISLPFEYCNYFYDFMIYKSVPYAAACGDAEFIMLDENEDWVLLNEGLPSNRSVNGLAHADRALFAYMDVYDMYVSLDDGNTWEQRTSGIDLDYGDGIRSFATWGTDDVFIATAKGVYYSGNYGHSWNKVNSGLINHNISDIALLNDTLYLGTQASGYLGAAGNGVWKCALTDIPLTSPDISAREIPVYFYPNPASDIIRFSKPGGNDPVLVEIFDPAGKKMLSENCETGELDISALKEGIYIITMKGDIRYQPGKLIIVR
jgi:photosystem II stability/assembly factor-like uncharacterized protein